MILHNPEQFVEQEITDIQKYKGSDALRDSMFKHLRELKELVLTDNNRYPDNSPSHHWDRQLHNLNLVYYAEQIALKIQPH